MTDDNKADDDKSFDPKLEIEVYRIRQEIRDAVMKRAGVGMHYSTHYEILAEMIIVTASRVIAEIKQKGGLL
jgi:hypothetical protein